VIGLIPRRHAIIAAYIFAAIAISIGLWLYLGFKTGPLTIPLGALAIIIGYTYTAKPFRLSYRGWGEISIWFSCGWLATIMGFYLQTGRLNAIATLASLPGAFSIFLVILINEIPDITSDKLFGKKNLAVRLGSYKAFTLYVVLLFISYASMIVIVFFGVPATSAYFSVILLPLMAWIIYTIQKRRPAERKVQELLSIRTMLYDHLITVIYTVSFVLEGLYTLKPDFSQLVMLAAAFIIVFSLEGLSLACSRVTFSISGDLERTPQFQSD
jgi:1,4-dihydroxy-2-naphthoate octaprenyltransferase